MAARQSSALSADSAPIQAITNKASDAWLAPPSAQRRRAQKHRPMVPNNVNSQIARHGWACTISTSG